MKCVVLTCLEISNFNIEILFCVNPCDFLNVADDFGLDFCMDLLTSTLTNKKSKV